MKSHIVGKIELDIADLQKDILKLEKNHFSSAYKDFAYGNWKTCVLWNQSGIRNAALIHDYTGFAVPTELGKSLKAIDGIIKKYFNISRLKFARVFSASNNGLVVPHIDYLELKKEFIRIHIPIQTDLGCFNSEANNVFHMRVGEIWYLHASTIHSAACFSNINRLHLVLDFEGSQQIESVFNSEITFKANLKPDIITREYFDLKTKQDLLSLSKIINEENFDDIVSILSKVHFKKNVCSSNMFEWLEFIVLKTKNKVLINKYKILARKCLVYRESLSANMAMEFIE